MTKKMKHTVTDINKWKSEHANVDAERKKHGVAGSTYEISGNTVIVRHDVTDSAAQKRFRESPQGSGQRRKASANMGEELEQ